MGTAKLRGTSKMRESNEDASWDYFSPPFSPPKVKRTASLGCACVPVRKHTYGWMTARTSVGRGADNDSLVCGSIGEAVGERSREGLDVHKDRDGGFIWRDGFWVDANDREPMTTWDCRSIRRGAASHRAVDLTESGSVCGGIMEKPTTTHMVQYLDIVHLCVKGNCTCCKFMDKKGKCCGESTLFLCQYCGVHFCNPKGKRKCYAWHVAWCAVNGMPYLRVNAELVLGRKSG